MTYDASDAYSVLYYGIEFEWAFPPMTWVWVLLRIRLILSLTISVLMIIRDHTYRVADSEV